MQGLTLQNFKSYKKSTVLNFNPYINIILGANGQGKSNIFKALAFALSDRLQINRSQFSAYMHHGINISNNNDQTIQVEILMKQPSKLNQGNNLRQRDSSREIVKLTKMWKNDLKEQCYVNSKIVNKKQYQNYIESLCLSYTNPYNIVQQGKINQIILMDQFQLFKLMEQITGVKKFNKRKEQALAILNKVQNQKMETKGILSELDQKLKAFQDRKQQFEYYAAQQKTKKYRTKKHYLQLMESTKHNLQKIKNQYEELSDNLGKVITKKHLIQQKLQENITSIKIEKDKLTLIGKTVNAQEQYFQSQQLIQLQKIQKEVKKQLKQQAKKMREKDKIIESFKKDFAELEQNYQSLKISKQLQKPKQSKQKLLLAYEAQIKNEQASLNQMKAQKQKSQQKIKQLQKFLNSKKNLELQTQNQKITHQLLKIRQQHTDISKQISQLVWQRDIQTLQLNSMKQSLQNSQLKLRKLLPHLDLTLLALLRQQKIKGVYGFLIQYVTIDQKVSFAYEIAGMHALTSLLVQDQEACAAVVEVNRRIKGGQVNILQLDYIRNRPVNSHAAIKANGVHKLSNAKFIKPNLSQIQANNIQNSQTFVKDIQKLIKNTFQKYALVKDYDTGLQISKQYHINCITGDRQIVYSKGYHCKIGQSGIYQDCKLDIYYKFQEKKQIYLEKSKQKGALDLKLLEFENNSVNLLNQQQKLSMELNKLAFNVNQITTQKKMLQVYQTNIDKIIKNQQQIRLSLQKKQQTLKTIQQNSSKSQPLKFSPAQCQKIQSTYHIKRKQLNKMLTQIFELQQILQKLTIQKQQIDQKVINTKNAKASGLINPNQILNEIQKLLSLKQKQNKDIQKQIEELNNIQQQIQRNRNHVQIKLITYRAEQEDIQGKLAEIGEIQEDVQELQELSNSMSVSALHGRKKHHFSARDRILFTKLATIIENFAAHKKTFAQLQQSQQKIHTLIENYEKQSEQYLHQMSSKFEKQFNDIFSFIVNQGTAEIRFKKISEKARDNTTRYRNCLSVKVSFSHTAQVMKKWNDFSGGERTVIAISIIFALQRCQPAPFYVLDEIDAALDSVYVQKIAELLARQSQRNKCQYFVSSFKQDMMTFPEEICNYYLVSAENRESFIEKIRKNKAVDTLRSISSKNGHNNT